MNCNVADCPKQAWSRGLCSTHYNQWRKGKPLPANESLRYAPLAECSIEGCHGAVIGWGWCRKHYFRWKRNGDPLALRRWAPPEVRFWRQVDKNGPIPDIRPDLGPCWLWTGGGSSKSAYGLFEVSYKDKDRRGAHVYAYQLQVGSIPDGHQVDHLCFVPKCVRGSHLEAVTCTENNQRRVAAKPQRPWKVDRRRGVPQSQWESLGPR